jgi:hypothetical protein
MDSEDDGFRASNAFGISSVTTLFLVESDGTISNVTEGWRKNEAERLAGLAGTNPFGKPVEGRGIRLPAGAHDRIIRLWRTPSKISSARRPASPKGWE